MKISDIVRTWSDGRFFLPRAILMILLLIQVILVSMDPYRWTPFAPIDLVIHEIGHPLFSVFGEWMSYAGGTILQHLVPILCCFILLKQEEYFGLPFCGVWFSANILETAHYIAETDNPNIELVTLGIGDDHVEIRYTDWEYLLDRIPGLSMEYAQDVAFVVKITGLSLMWLSVAIGFWILWHMKNNSLKFDSKA